jgi:hypothetical protein
MLLMAMPSKRFHGLWRSDTTVMLIYGRFYCLSILDKHHHPDISLEQGLKILEMCTDEIKRRLPIDYKGVRCTTVSPLAQNNLLTIRSFWSRLFPRMA